MKRSNRQVNDGKTKEEIENDIELLLEEVMNGQTKKRV
jgi:hypothetical protein